MPTRSSPAASIPAYIPTLGVIGVGLIGGSFAAALRAQGIVGKILGVGRRPETMQKALDLGLVDAVASLEEAVTRADVLLLATPVQTMATIFANIYPLLPAHTILIDAGSTKQNIIAAARQALQEKVGQFVPCHPIAGSNIDGPEAAQPHLFVDRRVIICPLPENDPQAVADVQTWWQTCGSNTLRLAPAQHDAIYARVSHLPHLIAFGFMDALLKHPDAAEMLQHAGTGFKDFTRIAASSPELWRDVFLANSEPVLDALQATIQSLQTMQVAIQEQDSATLDRILQEAAQARHAWNLTF